MNFGVSDPDAVGPVASVDVAVATRPMLVRDVLAWALGARLGLRVVAFDASSGDDVTHRLQEVRPRILLIDDSASNLEAVIRRLHRASPWTRILALTTRSDEEALRQLARAGAHGVVQNRSDLATLVRAVEAASQGKVRDPRPALQSVPPSSTGTPSRQVRTVA